MSILRQACANALFEAGAEVERRQFRTEHAAVQQVAAQDGTAQQGTPDDVAPAAVRGLTHRFTLTGPLDSCRIEVRTSGGPGEPGEGQVHLDPAHAEPQRLQFELPAGEEYWRAAVTDAVVRAVESFLRSARCGV